MAHVSEALDFCTVTDAVHLFWMLQAIAEVCAVCNEARIESKEGVFRAAGAPTEAALVVLAEKLGIPNAQQSAAIAAARKSDPDAHADGVQQWYCAK